MKEFSSSLYRNSSVTMWTIGKSQLAEVNQAVVNTYRTKFGQLYDWDGAEAESMAIDDVVFLQDAEVFGAYDQNHTLLGTVRVIEKSDDVRLPIERDFELSARTIVANMGGHSAARIFEIGRFAKTTAPVSRAAKLTSKFAIEELIRCAIMYCERQEQSYAFASIDQTVLQMLTAVGFPWVVLGPAKDYVGSPTIPAVASLQHCRDHIQRSFPATFARFYDTSENVAIVGE